MPCSCLTVGEAVDADESEVDSRRSAVNIFASLYGDKVLLHRLPFHCLPLSGVER